MALTQGKCFIFTCLPGSFIELFLWPAYISNISIKSNWAISVIHLVLPNQLFVYFWFSLFHCSIGKCLWMNEWMAWIGLAFIWNFFSPESGRGRCSCQALREAKAAAAPRDKIGTSIGPFHKARQSRGQLISPITATQTPQKERRKTKGARINLDLVKKEK